MCGRLSHPWANTTSSWCAPRTAATPTRWRSRRPTACAAVSAAPTASRRTWRPRAPPRCASVSWKTRASPSTSMRPKISDGRELDDRDLAGGLLFVPDEVVHALLGDLVDAGALVAIQERGGGPILLLAAHLHLHLRRLLD